MKTLYLMRHSKPLNVNNEQNSDSLQIQNEKKTLSIEGEEIAKNRFNNKEFDNIDVVFSSNYVRAIQTAKYLSEKNDLEINVVSELGERKFGITSCDELPEKFERKQFLEEDYKIGDGESQKEVRDRMYNAIMKILDESDNKRIAIVSHGTAISYLLKKWCKIEIVNDTLEYSFNGKIILHGYFNYCEAFKLEFDDNNEIIDINNISF